MLYCLQHDGDKLSYWVKFLLLCFYTFVINNKIRQENNTTSNGMWKCETKKQNKQLIVILLYMYNH